MSADHEDYWDRKDREAREESAHRVSLNPHQFGDQLTLFNAPLGQPDMGMTKGNPNARLYRTVTVPDRHRGDVSAILEHISRPGSDVGHSRQLGIHWQHDREYSEDLANTGDRWAKDAHSVIIEADHPGHEHVVDYSHRTGVDPLPKGVGDPDAYGAKRNHLKGEAKDWSLIHDTVGPHDMLGGMLPEVPIRPGSPMHVHAIHTPDPERSGEYIRNPVQFKGIA